MGHRLSRSFYRGWVQDRPVFIKVYREGDITSALFQPDLVAGLLDSGFKTPRVLYHALDPEVLSTYRCGCLITEWIEAGTQPLPGKLRPESAFANLARLHHRDLIAGRTTSSKIAPPGQLHSITRKWTQHMIDRSLKRLDRAGVPLRREEARSRFQPLKSELKEALSQSPPNSLLHLDYAPSNVITDEKGELYTLDLDKARKGCFAIDLAIAMTHYAFEAAPGRQAAGLLRGSPWASSIEESYFSAAEPGRREYWSAWRATHLRLAFLRKTGNLAARALDPIRYGARERIGFARLAAECFEESFEWESMASRDGRPL